MSAGRPIGIAIVEDEREVREGLRYLLGLDGRIKVLRAFGRAEEFLESLREPPFPDLVLMDIGLPGMGGIEATRRALEIRPELVVLILTVFEEEEKILAAIRAGAIGYLLKNTKPDILLDQIASAVADGSPISPTVARSLLAEIRRGGPGAGQGAAAADYALTARENEILVDIVGGYTSREIAERHNMAASTAKKHILHIYQKLNVSNRAEFVKKAISERLV
ncbi:MAG: response regulator transcription factor [Spirochaetaceae bacterium]|nr:response regulator transcription factor [Spirochaetaceae bacterium]